MPKKDPRVDAYIAGAPDFAKPILTHIRAVVHAACPEVEETLKWRMPSFLYRGILCGMAAFKQHCTFGFWKGALIVDANGRRADEAMGQFGRLTSVKDLPAKKVLSAYIHKAMELNESGVTSPKPKKAKAKKELAVPPDLAAALKKNAKARATFEGFSPSHKREYIEWITEAKREETREKRLATTIEWLTAGKPRNWKYMNC